MSGISLNKWQVALTSILEELEEDDYRKMLEFLVKIPQGKKNKPREAMPRTIIQCYGLPDSISEIQQVMVLIPRNDPKIQDLLSPFVDQLKNEQEKENKETKRKREDNGLKDEAPHPSEILGQGSRCQLDRGMNAPLKKSIQDLKSSGIQETEGFLARGVQKSGLREARELLCPERTVKEAKGLVTGARVSVQGSVTRIYPVEKIAVKHKRWKIKRQKFLLTDETDYVRIVMWDKEAVQQSEGLSIGDVVKVTNTRVNEYLGRISLDSTSFTKIHKV